MTRRVLAAAVVAAVAGACGGPGPAGRPRPAPPSEMTVVLGEFRFGFDPRVAAGRVNLFVRNDGAVGHQLILARLPDDYPADLDAQLRSPVRRRVEALRGLPVLAPGDGTVFAADLSPARYAFFCFVVDADGVAHALKGMNAQFRVGAAPPGQR